MSSTLKLNEKQKASLEDKITQYLEQQNCSVTGLEVYNNEGIEILGCNHCPIYKAYYVYENRRCKESRDFIFFTCRFHERIIEDFQVREY